MEHEMIVRLTDDEIEELINELNNELRIRQSRSTKKSLRTPEQQKVSKILYEAGLTDHIPSGERLSEEEEAELMRLAELFGQAGGKPASEMVIEDRGPY